MMFVVRLVSLADRYPQHFKHYLPGTPLCIVVAIVTSLGFEMPSQYAVLGFRTVAAACDTDKRSSGCGSNDR